jgi:hypothetical protein
MLVALFGNNALTLLAGIVKATALPPVENWTAGSSPEHRHPVKVGSSDRKEDWGKPQTSLFQRLAVELEPADQRVW